MNKQLHWAYLTVFATIFMVADASATSFAEGLFLKLRQNIQQTLAAHHIQSGLFLPPPPSATVSVRVNAGSDDAEQNLSTNAVVTNSNDLELVNDGVGQSVGMRFNGITVPKNATITSAYIEFVNKTALSTSVTLTISGQAIDNAPTFTTASNNITGRTKTTATVSWTPGNWATVNSAYQSADISTIVQEIVNRSGWVSGNSMVMMVNTASTNLRRAYSYENGNTALAPLLVVNYTLVEICGNSIDDDGDGLIDGADLDCGTFCPTGGLTMERWLSIGSGNLVSDLTSNANYPNNPSETMTLTSFDGPDNYADNYGTRVRGYITPSQTGIYSFNLTSDDGSELYMSTDADPTNKALIASVVGYTGIAEYTKYVSQTSANLLLIAGQNYYVELLQKEGGGGDHFQVYWKTPSNSTWTIVPGTNLRPFGCSEICGNGIDDDGDGLVDGADGDCGSFCSTGKINLERWLSISGTAITDLTSNANFPNTPSQTTTLTSLDGPDNFGDNFGQRARGYISPTQTGIYTFNLTSDDAGELYLSTDANPANKKLIASVTGWTNSNEYTKYGSQTSYSILLHANRNYYVEILNKEGSGGDHFQVYWKTPSNLSWEIIPGNNLRPFVCTETCDNNIDDDGDGFMDCNCDMMTNGEFDNGLTGWGMNIQPGNAAAGALDNTSQLSGIYSGAVTITTASGTDWHIQAYQAGLSLQSGKTYTVSFQSKSSGSRTMGVALQQSVSPYTVYWAQTVTLSTVGNTFTFDYPSTITNNGQVVIMFNMGQSNKKVWIDKISVTPNCISEICGNGFDDDGNGLIDCADGVCPVPIASISGLNSVCNGNSTTLTASGGGTYAWNTGATTAAISVTPVSTTTYTVTVTNASGCTATANRTVTVSACAEICGNGIDDDGDGLSDCADNDCKKITLATPVVSACINQPLQDVATVSVQVSWVSPPANDQIEVKINNQTERINVGGGATSPQTVTFTVPANGLAGQTITASWMNNTSLCSSTTTFSAPTACSSDQVGCKILYLCGQDKPYDGDAWDHGFMAYLDEINGSNAVTPILTKADASGMGTYDVMNQSTFVNVNLNDYGLVVISATTEGYIATGLVTALKSFSGAVMNCNYTIINDLGMSASEGSYQFQSNLFIDNTTSKAIYNFNNDVNPYGTQVFTRGNYTAAADAFLWTSSGEQSSGINGAYFVYSTADVLPGVAAGHGRRVFLGYHMNGFYANAQNGGALPAPVSSYLVPATHFTLEGKYYLDLAIIEATKGCATEICNNGIDDNDNGLVDCQETICGMPNVSGISKTNASNCPSLNNGQITVSATGTNLTYSIDGGATYQASNIFNGLAGGTYNVRVRNSVTGCFVNYASNPVSITGSTCSENCTNGIDDDGDGLTDCLDSDCAPIANAGTDVSICLGASYALSVSASGGTAPYTYSWSNGLGAGQSKTVSPVATTTYTVTVSSAGGCTATDQVTVTVAPCSEVCGDGLDNDADGLIDCDDADCTAIGAPQLSDDVYLTCPGAVFQEQPIFNDNNLQNPVYSIYTNPAKGTVSINYQGVFTYTPNNSSCGVDSFQYQVCNAMTGCCDQATVVLNRGDSAPPALQNVPADITINCSDPVPTAPVVFGMDACPGIFVTFNEVNNQVNSGSCQQYNIVRTWTATDQCGNSGSASQTIHVSDPDSPELFRLYTLPNGKKLVAGVVSKATTNWQRIKFPTNFNETPVLFSQVVGNNSAEAVISRVRNIDNEGFDLKLQEEENGDGVHAAEQVAWMALEPGEVDGGSNLQAGLLANVTQAPKLLNYANSFSSTPVTIAATQSYAEADPFQVRFNNSTNTSTQVYLEEEQSKDVEVGHANESLGFLAVKPGHVTDTYDDFVAEAGSILMDNNWQTVYFTRKFTKPVVIFGGQPIGNDPSTIRVRNVTSTSFEVRIQEWQYLNGVTVSRSIPYLVVEGSVPAHVENACSEPQEPILPGVNFFAVDNCDVQVSMDYTESSTLTPEGLILTNIWVSADDCGNTSTLIRNDTCRLAAVRLKTILNGATLGNPSNASLMRDNLRANGLIPLENPYKLEPLELQAGNSPHIITPSMLQGTGDNAIVDWILVQIRDTLNPKIIVQSVPCLIQRDGDVVTEVGNDVITFPTIPEGKYHVYIKHRSHLAMMTSEPVYLKIHDVPLVDFSISGSHIYNSNVAGRVVNGRLLSWAGDFNDDNRVIYQGPSNDVFTLFSEIMVAPSNEQNLANYILVGYENTDYNMDGKAIYQGPGNDRSMLLLNSILSHPANVLLLANFIASQTIMP